MPNSLFQKLKSNLELNECFDKLIQQKHGAVRSVIERVNPKITTKLIGSLQRKTKIRPIEKEEFDIDILVILGQFDNWVSSGSGIAPSDALQNVHSCIGESVRYGSMGLEKDAPVVTFEYKDGIRVELVPAYIDNIGHWADGTLTERGRGYWVPKNNKWELADYDHEAEHLSLVNSANDGFLVPTIKMLKALKRIYFPDLNSFHLEILSIQVIPIIINFRKERMLSFGYPILIKDFFILAKDLLEHPIKVPNSNSPTMNIDVLKLDDIKNVFDILYQYCEKVEMQQNDNIKIEMWKKLFNGVMI